MSEIKPSGEQSGEHPRGFMRRDFLRTFGAVAAGAALTGLVGEAGRQLFENAVKRRSEELHQIEDFLLGRSFEKLSFFGKELNHDEFCSLLLRLSEPTIPSREVLKELLKSFVSMMEIEDRFAGPLNVLPRLEYLELAREKYAVPVMEFLGVDKETLLLADTFGYGQIHPETASDMALGVGMKLEKSGMLSQERRETMARTGASFQEIVETLGLMKNENLIFSFLSFYEGYNLYGRGTGGVVHGGLIWPETRGQLQAVREQNPRAFTLAITAYSAGLEAPMVAKAQTYFNELCLADPVLRERSGLDLLVVDGDIGQKTAQMFRWLSDELGIEPPEDLLTEKKSVHRLGSQIVALDSWLAAVRSRWLIEREGLLNQDFFSKRGLTKLRALVEGRYHLQIKAYKILKKYLPEEKLKEIFFAYVDKRREDFLDLISKPDFFEKATNQGAHQDFVKSLAKVLPDTVIFDDRFKGVVPIFYREAKQFGADPINMPARVLLAYEIDGEDRFKITR